MESEPPLENSNSTSQQSSHKKVHINESSSQNNSRMIKRTKSEPIPDESNELVRTPSTFVHVDSAEFQEDRIQKELSCSTEISKSNEKEDKSSEYDAPVIDISDAKI